MNHKQPDENSRLSFEQTCEMARYYGNLRFAMFTVFTAILGGLVAVELGEVGPLPDGPKVFWFRLASVVLTSLFTLAEWRVADLVVFYQEEAARFAGQFEVLRLPLPPRHFTWSWLARAIMIAPFVLAVLFWIVSLVLWPTQKITS